MSLTGRRVLITGASSGIGKAIAHDLAARGAKLALLARSSTKLHEVARDTRGTAIETDLRDAGSIAEGIHAVRASLGGLDAVVNNAGNFRLGYVTDGLHADWRDMVQVNLLGMLAVTQAAIPYLAESHLAQIVNISSMSGRRVSHPATGVYASTKHAVHALSDALRSELHSKGIRVTVVSPGTVRTNEGSYITDPVLRGEARMDQRETGLQPEDVAAVIRHVLLSPPSVHLIEIAMMSSRQYPG